MRHCYFSSLILVSMLLGWGSNLMGQTGITSNAVISLVDAGETCNGLARQVEVYVNINGFLGTNSEPAGLNSFVLSFTLDSPGLFASAIPGDTPVMEWGLMTTQRSLITTHLTLVGWVADTLASNVSYHVATILFSGAQGTSGMSLDHAGSSLGSRVVAASGDGPGPISIDAAAVAFTIDIPANFNLEIHTGSSRWLSEDSEYALIHTPNGPINVQDLVKLISCGAN